MSRSVSGTSEGYFVEVGVGNGVTHSNTLVLERDLGWSGLLIEANPGYAKQIRRMRAATCINACADFEAHAVDFINYGYLGGIVDNDTDNSIARRRSLIARSHRVVRLEARSLDEILRSANAPAQIDYLSIDVEGAEFRVLQGLTFHNFLIKAVTIERPTPAIHHLLSDAGFVLAKYRLWDGFYVSTELARDLAIEAPRASKSARRLF